jgi:cell division transport system permease protein
VRLPYSLREGIAGFRRAKFAALASTSAIAVALVLIGVMALVGYKGQQVSTWLRQRVGELEVHLQEVDPSVAEALTTRAQAMPGVTSTRYISQKEAQKIFRRDFGEGADQFFESGFLPASIRVQVASDYANPDSLQALRSEFSTWSRVDEVIYNRELLAKVQRNLQLFTIVGLGLGSIVVIAALFLVGNTIRLTIYARRLLIRTMKLVGATDAFIRRPFLIEGALQGLLAGLLSAGVVGGLYALMVNYLSALRVSSVALAVLLAGIVLVGLVLGWLGSLVAVRRFIKNVALH